MTKKIMGLGGRDWRIFGSIDLCVKEKNEMQVVLISKYT